MILASGDINIKRNKMQELDEIAVGYFNAAAAIEELANSMPNKRILLTLKGHDWEEKILEHNFYMTAAALKNRLTNNKIAVVFPNYTLSIAPILDFYKKENIDFFFASPAIGYADLEVYSKIGASDVYLVGQLGFDVRNVKKTYPNLTIRIIPYVPTIVCNVTRLQELYEQERMFFIRPEDYDIMDKYVDVYEFSGHKRAAALFDIYMKDKHWNGPLEEIIEFSDVVHINNRGLTDTFGIVRTKCGGQCARKGCNLCKKMVELANTMEELGIGVKHESSKSDN